jgi:hypothetical protein
MVETFYKIEVTKEKYTESAEYYTLARVHLTGSFFEGRYGSLHPS